MATVECCEFLSGATKAKLQDAGVLFLSDLTRLVTAESIGGCDERTSQLLRVLKSRLAQRVRSCAQAADGSPLCATSARSSGSPTTLPDTLAATPIESISFFTENEVDEVYEAVKHQLHRSTATEMSASGALARAPAVAPEVTATIPGCQSVRQILAGLEARRAQGLPSHVTTFSRELDALLGGGVPVGGVTEVSGPPGVGKTQLLLQLAVSCAMPVEFGGLGGSCIFVDTEGSFVAERLEQMATAAVSLVHTILSRNEAERHERDRAVRVGRGSHSGGGAPPLVDRVSRKRDRGDSNLLTSTASLANEALSSLSGNGHDDAPHRSNGVAAQVGESSSERGLVNGGSLTNHVDFTVESVLQRVQYVRLTELTDLLALVYELPLLLNSSTEAQVTGSHGTPVHDDPPVRMVLIDSIALPFRSSDAFETNATVYDDMYGSLSALNSLAVGTNAPAHGTLSKQGLWQRSRLLYQCSTALEELAATAQLALVVTNHMTSKLIKTSSAGNGQALRATTSTEGEGSGVNGGRQTVLLPALGDAWGHGLSTRLLLAYHHYELPSCAFTSSASGDSTNGEGACLEDVVYTTTSTPSVPSGAARIVQHRVARLLKASGQPRRETCFLITTKGVRDVRKDMVKTWVTAQTNTSN